MRRTGRRPSLPGLVLGFLVWLAAQAAFGASISSFNPTFGGPGTVVNIHGSGLFNATEVKIGNLSGSAIIQFKSDSLITVTVQENAVTGQIGVTGPSLNIGSSSIFTVAPRITGFSPASAPPNTPNIVIAGENFITGSGNTVVRFGGVEASAMVTAPNQISATVPNTAVTGPITVTTYFSGNQLSGSSGTNFIVTGTGPVITGFSPTSGLPGTQVRIDGGDFTGASSVKFNGTNASFAVTAPTQIHAFVPDDATTGPITVTTPAGTATNAVDFVVTGVPLITDFTPGGGPAGTVVVINGSRFLSTTNVTFNGTNAPNFTVTADSQIHVTVPADATTGPIRISNTNGTTASATSFVVGDAPAIDNFTPTGGPVGTMVTVNGANFQNVTNVNFNGTNATVVTITSFTQLSAKVPPEATSGPITIKTLTGTATSTASFIVGAAPSVTNFSPYFGNNGTAVLIGGQNFLAGETTVQFNGVTAADAVVTSGTQISATVPAGATTGPITVFTFLGTNSTDTNFFVTPRLDGFSPTNGVAGATITVTGLNFIGATAVQFNGVAAGFTVSSTSEILATVPAAAITGPVSVTTPAGVVTTTTNFHVRPAISVLTPDNGPVGASVIITGSGFVNVSNVFFNGAEAVFTTDSSTQISTAVPADATSGPVTVVAFEGTAVSPADFVVVPTLGSFTPDHGGYGTPVGIIGTGLLGVTGVRFNGVNASFTIESATQISAAVPGGATTGPIELVTPATNVISAGDFTVTTTVTSFTPTNGTVGTVVTINGSGLTNLVDVQFNGVAAEFEAVSESQLRATVPDTATTGLIRVSTAQGLSYSTESFYVLPWINAFSPTNGVINTLVTLDGSGFDGATNVQFNGTNAVFSVLSPARITVTVPPTATPGPITVSTPAGSMTTSTNFHLLGSVTGFSPAAAAEGQGVFVYGTGFATDSAIQFNGTSALSRLWLSSTNLFVLVPEGARNGPITVDNGENAAASAAGFTVLPWITSFTPTNGLVGATVTIAGTSFYDVSAVRFNGLTAAFVTDSANQITATVPETATTGAITVTTPDGTATSTNAFVVEILRLGIRSAANNNVVITWPGVATDYTLQSTLSLTPTIVWTPVAETPVLIDGKNTVTNSAASGARFYRLKK